MVETFAKDQLTGFSNTINKVAIIGAGGRMGRQILQHLLATGRHTVTVITRPTSTVELPENIKVLRVDYTTGHLTALKNALCGQQALVITMAVTAPPDTVSKIIQAATMAGVRYVMPNWFGHDAAHDEMCKDTMLANMRDNIYSSFKHSPATSYILLICGFWYEFSLGGGPDRFGFDFKNRSLTLFDNGDVPINVSTWSHCGHAIASLLSLKDLRESETDDLPVLSQYRNSKVYISSFRLSQKDMFESVKRVTNTTAEDWIVDDEPVRQRWVDSAARVQKGDFSAFPRMLYSRTFFLEGGGDYESRVTLDNEALGLPLEDLDERTAVAVQLGEQNEEAVSH